MVVICKKYNKHLVGFGIYFLLIHSLVYELTPMIISEVTFTFFTILSIYLIFTNTYKKGYISAIVYGLSVLTRPIGIVLLPIFFYISKNKKKFLSLFISILILASSFNFFTADRFIVSDFNMMREDGLYENTGYADYLTNLLILMERL